MLFRSQNPVGTVTFSGPPVAVVHVPNELITDMAVEGSCNSRYIVDLPVDIVLERNRRYWLSIMPRFPAQPQVAWNLADQDTGFESKVGFPADAIEFWSDSGGNIHGFNCMEAPPAGTRTDLSFQLYGEDAPPTDIACCNLLEDTCLEMLTVEECLALNPFTIAFVNATCADIECPVFIGACCDDATGTCSDNINLFDCLMFDNRFELDATCATLDPPCGTVDLGACCLSDGCQLLTPTECSQLAGDWFAGDCGTVMCPAANDICINAAIITEDGVYPFSNVNAETDGPLDSPGGICQNITKDIWFRYIAPCTGNVTVATCSGTNFDSALNVYDGCFCDGNLGPILACHNDNCGPDMDDAQVTFAATEGQCYLIRVGGAFGAEGEGLLVVGCVPAELGACCNSFGACELLTEPECMMSGGDFTPGAPCSPITCPLPDNDECVGALPVSQGVILFDNTGATDSLEPQPGGPCTDITNDIWFRHTATCDGTLVVSTCGATNFDAAVAIYEDDCLNGPDCDPLGDLLGCDNDGCDIIGGPAEASVNVVAGQCVLIRVGGVEHSTGTGSLLIGCIPAGQGACCDALTGCELRLEAECQGPGDVFTLGATCAQVTCPVPENDDCANATEIGDGVFDFFTLRADRKSVV